MNTKHFIIAAFLMILMSSAAMSFAADAPPRADTGNAADVIDAVKGAPTVDDMMNMAKSEPLAVKLANVIGNNRIEIHFIWAMICAFLVFFMQTGFAMLGTGFTRAMNAGHTMAMNMMVFVFGVLGYWICGFAIQNAGAKGFLLSGSAYDVSIITAFMVQVVFMNIAATIPIGAMAERWTFKSFVIYVFFISMVAYPIYAGWVWGGWLSHLGKNFGLGHGVVDFAGSSVVHMTGGICALAGAMVLGPRMGKFRNDGTPNAIPGHHIPMAIIGCLILFFGWFGFNSGSAVSGNFLRVGVIAVNTMLAAAAASFSAMLYMWVLYGKPDISLSANGLLAGLVAISASCVYVSPVGAVMIGFIAGILCCISIFFVERRLKVDDPVGAISVHGTCGAWGLIGLGLFADGSYGYGINQIAGTVKGLFYGGASQLAAEFIGVFINFIFVFAVMFAFFKILDKIIPMRVSAEIEFDGLDQSEVAVTAYPDFNLTKTRR
jgi:Amt family ammonium transporter